MSCSQSVPILRADFYTEVPIGIAQNLEYCLEQGGRCPDVIAVVRDRVTGLIDALKSGGDVRGSVDSISAISVNGLGKLLDKVDDREAHDIVIECVNRIRALALRTLQIKSPVKPCENPIYELWTCRITRHSLLGAKLLGVMGQKSAGTLFSAKELEEAVGIKDNGSNSTRNTLYEISARSRGTDFELVVCRSGRDVNFFINPNLGGEMKREEIDVEMFIKKVAPREGTHEWRMAQFLVRNLGKWLATEEIASGLGVETKDFGRMIIGPLNRISERCDGSGFKLEKETWINGVPRKKYRLVKSS